MGLFNKPKQPFVVGKIRQSQAITTFGIGSIVDFVNQTVMISGTDNWDWYDNNEYRINNVNLQNLLGVKYFVKPKISLKEKEWGKENPDLHSTIFPKILYSPKCKQLEEEGKRDCKLINKTYKCLCETCRSKHQYLPSRFVLVCPKGHIEDFPYAWWVHEGQGKERCEENPRMKMYYTGNKTDMESLYIECSNCGAKRSMKTASARNAFSKYKCTGNRPWLGDKESCAAGDEGKFMQMLIRNESSVYFPYTVSALTIPPWSSKIAKEIQKTKNAFEKTFEFTDADKPRFVDSLCKKMPYVNRDVIEELLEKLLDKEYQKIQTTQSIMEDEYDAITRQKKEEQNGDFISHEEEVSEDFKHLIDNVIAIDRLTVVTAMVGFTRLTAPTKYDDENMAPLSKTKKDWYPAIEQHGEGIFIKFNQNILDRWSNKFGERYSEMGKKLDRSFFYNERFSPQYVFLHTFAHLFIRELSNLCGYSTASIKERIYSSFNGSKKKMSGVLVYTSTSDSEGSLGGLIEQAQKIKLEIILKSMLERGKWCSLDPICYTSKEQGFMSLNYAACFACSLLPETSCEFNNILLDRCSVCGMPGNEELGLFNWRG